MSSRADAAFYTQLLRAYLDSANDAIFVVCDELKFLVCNPLMAAWMGLSEDELTAHNQRRPITELLGHTESVERFRAAAEQAFQGRPQRFECFISPERNKARWIEINMTRVDVEAGDMIIAVARDTTEKHEQLARIHYQSLHDTLTGLPNREYLQECLQGYKETSDELSLLVVDLARFKDVNEALGHDIADDVLRIVGNGLQNVAKPYQDCTVCRLTGDQFAIVCTGSAAVRVNDIAAVVQTLFAKPIHQSGFDLTLGCKIGLAMFPSHVVDCGDLLRSAEVALYEAKSHPTARIKTFCPELSNCGNHRLALVNDLNAAIENRQLHVCLQPIVPLRGEAPLRLEALARWTHSENGEIQPEQFISLAEATGQIVPVTQLIMEQALDDCAQLIRQARISTVSVNISPHCLLDLGFARWVAALMQQKQIPSEALMLEITESVAMSDRMQKYSVIALKELGVQVSIDDFGTGHSSLSKLKQLPVTELKIDKSFVLDMLQDENDAAIVEASIHLAHSLKLEVVAEGIENNSTLERLKQLGCDYAQGMYLCKPLRLPALLEWLGKRNDADQVA